MFDPWCPRCASRVLVPVRRLVRLEPTATGQRAHLRCWCGEVVVKALDRPRPGPREGAPPVPGAASRVA